MLFTLYTDFLKGMKHRCLTHACNLMFFQVSNWLKPNVKTRSGQGENSTGMIHIARQQVCSILTEAGMPYSSQEVKKLCATVDGAMWDFRSTFGKPPQTMAIRLPREAVKHCTLAAIDSCEYATKL